MDKLKTLKYLFLLLLLPMALHAQTPSPYHRFGLVLSRGSGVNANIVPYANITVCIAGSNPCQGASIFYDVGLTSPVLGPVVADANGNFSYYLSGNQCVDEYYSSPSITSYTISNVCSSYVNNNTGSSTSGQALVNFMSSVAGRNIADGGTIATLTSTVPLAGGTMTGTLVAPTINVTALLSTPSLILSGGAPITSQSSAGGQVVTCSTGGTGAQYCDASGSWTNIAGYSLPPPTLSTLGGIFSSTAAANKFATGVDTSGNVVYTQPTYSNLGGSVPTWNQNTTGNSGTTDSFASVPTNCGTAGAAYGIDSSGNALCGTSSTFTGASGYQVLPSGLILEWAEGSTCTSDCTETVTFPLPFPNACLTVQTSNDNSISPTNITKDWGINSPCTTTGVSVELQRRGDEGSFSAAPIVFAVGH